MRRPGPVAGRRAAYFNHFPLPPQVVNSPSVTSILSHNASVRAVIKIIIHFLQQTKSNESMTAAELSIR